MGDGSERKRWDDEKKMEPVKVKETKKEPIMLFGITGRLLSWMMQIFVYKEWGLYVFGNGKRMFSKALG